MNTTTCQVRACSNHQWMYNRVPALKHNNAAPTIDDTGVIDIFVSNCAPSFMSSPPAHLVLHKLTSTYNCNLKSTHNCTIT